MDFSDRFSVAWRWIIVLFTIVLLFGSPIQFLWTPKDADFIFDLLYITALVVFVVDMILNSLGDPFYLSLFHRVDVSDQPRLCPCGIGSFKMWCDVVSTAALLYDISYLNRFQYSEEVVNVTLNQLGLPNMKEFTPWYPIEVRNLDCFIVVCKAARVARLIPSTKVVELSSRVNFYWYIERLNPLWYCARARQHRKAQRKVLRQPQESPGLTGGIRRGASWGEVDIAALAKVKAMAGERRKKETELGFFSRALERMKRGCRTMGFLPNTNLELKRHIAAWKIQRAWRRRLAYLIETRSIDGLEIISEDGLDGGGGRVRHSSSNALDRVLKKRNMNVRGQSGRNLSSNLDNLKDRNDRRPKGNNNGSTRADSQVGTAMAEVTGQWVANIILFGLILTILFTYQERDATRPSTMVVLHGQMARSTTMEAAVRAVNVSRSSAIPGLYSFKGEHETIGEVTLQFIPEFEWDELRDREKLRIIVEDVQGRTEGIFDNRKEIRDQATVELLMTVFVLVVWFLAVAAFAGPIMTLVITPIERMVRLLGMLVMDPLGYQSNARFKKFMFEEEAIFKKSQWTKEVLKGMETSFLMSTILRIGSLMKVGFGSAGVEIIRHNLEQGQNNNMLILNSQGSTVSCIFLFCDVRQFTDATECLQEEVFVFTNKIAAVVHSICHSYGGLANKNVGDAFLVSWHLDDDIDSRTRLRRPSQGLVAKHNQADKALLCVVKICIALHYDEYYVRTMSDDARNALVNKLKDRKGPIVQMGFGLHAGKAVQGALGSERKIDATYVSEAVERAEFLESSTKQYGLKVLMSDTFHRLLHSSNRRRCRKIDRMMFVDQESIDNDEPSYDQGDIMELYTYDMDVEALWRKKKSNAIDGLGPKIPETELLRQSTDSVARVLGKGRGRRKSVLGHTFIRENRDSASGSDELRSGQSPDMLSPSAARGAAPDGNGSAMFDIDANEDSARPSELILPTGPALYSPNIWLQEDMRRIREPYTSDVFQTFNSGLQKYYDKDWSGARQQFETILERLEDGPSRFFLEQMKKHNWRPPPDFQPIGRA